MKTKWWIVYVVVIAVIVIGAAIYEANYIQVESGTITRCSDARHVGNRTIKSDVKTVAVPRWQAGRYKVVEKTTVCPKCQARLEKERQEAEKQARIEAIRSSLILTGDILIGQEDRGSVSPGGNVILSLSLYNRSNEPIKGLRVKIAPSDCFEFHDVSLGELYWSQAQHEESYTRQRRQWNELISNGLKVGECLCNKYGVERPVVKESINPVKSSCYQSEYFYWPNSSGSASEFVFLKKSISAGRDIQINYYVIYEGEKILLNTATISVVHP